MAGPAAPPKRPENTRSRAGRLPNAERYRGSRPSRIYAPTGALPSGRFRRGGSRPPRPKGSFEPPHAYLPTLGLAGRQLAAGIGGQSRLTGLLLLLGV